MSANVELLHSVVGQEPAARSEANDPGRKHRGLWSFLTRTFVLGQLIVAEHFFGNAARADDGGEGLAQGEGGSGSGAAATDAAAVLAAAATGDEAGATALANAQQAKTLAGAGPQAGGPGASGAGDGGVDVVAGGRQGAGADGAVEQAVADEAALIDLDDNIPGSPGGNHGPGSGGDGDHGTIIDPVIDIVGTVGGTVVDVVGNVGEVVNTVVGTVDVLVSNVFDTVQDILPPTVDLVTNTVTDVVDTLGQTVSTTAEIAFDAVDGILGSIPIVGEPLTAVTGAVENVASTTLETANSFVNGAVDGLGQTANTIVADVVPTVGNIVGSGVIPVLQSAVSSATNPDTLFEGGRYSDFNITLQSEPISGVASNLGSSVDSLLDGVTDLVDLPGEPPLHSVANLLGDPLKGGLGELFS